MSLSEAMKEAYASGDERRVEVWSTEITHTTFDAPIRFVTRDDGSPYLPDKGRLVDLPLVYGGPKVSHIPCAMRRVRPGHDQDGPTDGRIQIDNASSQIDAAFRAATGYGTPMLVTFRSYLIEPGKEADVTAPDEDIYDDLELAGATVDEESVQATLMYRDGRQVNVPTGPNAFFSRAEYPGI